MTAQHLAEKFSPKVQECFTKESFTNNAINKDYDFVGVQTISIYSVPTVEMGNYGRGSHENTGVNRYGTAKDLNLTVQELKLEIDRAFTFAIDKRDNLDSMGVLNPGKALERQIKERVIPEVDEYRIAKIIDDLHTAKSSNIVKTDVTSANAYSLFLDEVIKMMNAKVPMNGCFAYISPSFYKQIRLSSEFIKSGDLSQEMLVKGQVGMIDGIPLILVPDSYFPTHTATHRKWDGLDNIDTAIGASSKVSFMILHKDATVGAEKLVDYKVHDNPPGINGWLVEGRVCYDAFLLDKKADMVHVVVDNAPSN